MECGDNGGVYMLHSYIEGPFLLFATVVDFSLKGGHKADINVTVTLCYFK